MNVSSENGRGVWVVSRVRLMVVVVAGAVCAGALVGCSSPAVEPVGLTASPTAEQSPTPTPTPTGPATGVVLDLSDVELGIVFEDAPVLEGDAADVYNWVATFEVEYWRTLTTNTASPAFDVMAGAEVRARMHEIATNNSNDQSQIGGVFHATVGEVTVDGDSARATTCDDYRDVTVSDASGPSSLVEEGIDVPTLVEFTLARASTVGMWIIQSSVRLGTC